MTGLLVGPVVSEFGWELMEWQGYVRQRVVDLQPNRVVVCTTNGLEPLYDDFCRSFIPHHIRCDRDGHKPRGGKIQNPGELERVMHELRRTSNMWRRQGYRVSWMKSWGKDVKIPKHFDKQKFRKYGVEPAPEVYEGFKLLIHARNRSGGGPCGGDNYPKGHWNELLQLIFDSGIVTPDEVAAIGTREAALCPEGTVDARDINLTHLTNIMHAAQLVVGPSSGPMHLASLCGTPHVVWATGKYQSLMPQGNKDRYEKVWNPFKTPVDVLIHNKGQILPPKEIASVVLKALARKEAE